MNSKYWNIVLSVLKLVSQGLTDICAVNVQKLDLRSKSLQRANYFSFCFGNDVMDILLNKRQTNLQTAESNSTTK